ncbi:MAG: LLM class flavin-dependent oxidoreductase [Candidatus Latescibacteria bacterium]|nr:LLM class flavin-dependent oxidoreductase [Candidatus Latescibacterota bacterium]
MKLGVFMMPLHPPEKSRTECFEEDIDLVVLADELGYAEAWIGQHHTLAWEPIPANDLFIANVFPRTKNIRLGTGVSIVPQHHPANIAVRLAYLDHLSRGRLNCGFGQGGVPTDWELFNLPDPKTQGLMTVEGIDMILKLWQAQAPFDFKGQFWHIKVQNPIPELGIGELLKPYQQPHPPIAMSVIKPQSLAARMAGQRGYIPISTNLVPVSTVAEHWKTYSAGAAEVERKPARAEWRVSRSIIVGRTQQEAWELARRGSFIGSFKYLITILRSLGSLNLIKHDPELPDEMVTPEYMLEHQCIIGDVPGCIDQLQQVWQTTGGFGTLLMIAHDWDDREAWQRSMRLLAEQVAPALPSL